MCREILHALFVTLTRYRCLEQRTSYEIQEIYFSTQVHNLIYDSKYIDSTLL